MSTAATLDPVEERLAHVSFELKLHIEALGTSALSNCRATLTTSGTTTNHSDCS